MSETRLTTTTSLQLPCLLQFLFQKINCYKSMSTAKMIVLMSCDGQKFEVEKSTAVESETLRLMINDDRDENFIPVPNVHSTTLALVIQYCKKHAEAKVAEESTEAFDTEFVRVDSSTLFDLILAANYLDIKSLQDLTCQTVADMMKGMTPAEVRNRLNIEEENAWAFE